MLILYFILLMLLNLIQGASHHDRKSSRYHIRQSIALHYVIKRSFESPYCTWNPVQMVGRPCIKLWAGYHISIVLPLSQKKSQTLRHVLTTGTVHTREIWEDRVGRRGETDSCFSWFYYCEYVTREAEESKVDRQG